jgi:methylphosphotriester-DNA--protein-cysteine methyltransferase
MQRQQSDSIGKSRQLRPKLTVLNAAEMSTRCQREHFPPPPDLEPFLATSWALHWRLAAEESFEQRVLTDPCAFLIIEPNSAHFLGPVTGSYSATMTGDTFVLGLKFKPGGFASFTNTPLASLKNQTLPIEQFFPSANHLELRHLAAKADSESILASLHSLLRAHQPQSGPDNARVTSLVHLIQTDPGLLTISQLATSTDESPRTIQRLFRKHVGVTPKWMILRCRIQEAAAQIEAGQDIKWADFAHSLGYFDQSHFINEFTSMVGEPPATYAATLALNSTDK